MRDPLNGVRILDLTNVLSGPFCCTQLAYLGAEVIKVEVPGRGDLARQLGADPGLNQALMGVSFLAQNAGKKSMTLNLKHPQGVDALKRLVKTADVLVENFRPGVMDRLGVGFTELKQINPGLIYCAISGFGASGPMQELPAYDQIIQGLSGVMSITGDANTAPYRVGFPIADTIGGLTAAMAINGALAGRATKGGEGSYIDVSMLESTMVTMGWVISNFLVAGQAPQALGNTNFTASPSGAFRTKTGPINIAANKQEQFEALCDVIDRPDLKTDPLFVERQMRLENRDALTVAIEAGFVNRDAKELVQSLNAAGVPAGEILDVPAALDMEQVRGRDFIRTFDDVPGVAQPVKNARAGYHLDGAALDVDHAPPALGADTDAILQELGYSAQNIAHLRQEQAI